MDFFADKPERCAVDGGDLGIGGEGGGDGATMVAAGEAGRCTNGWVSSQWGFPIENPDSSSSFFAFLFLVLRRNRIAA